MVEIKPIKTLLCIENILCVYRNYSFCNEKRQKIVLTRIVIETIFFILMSVYIQITLFKYFGDNLSSYCIIVAFSSVFLGHSVYCVLNSIAFCDSFKDIYNNLVKLNDNFENDITCNEYFNNLNFKTIFGSVAFFICITYDITSSRIYANNIYELNFGDVVTNIIRVLADCRYAIEYLVYFILIMILNKLFKCFNSLLEETQRKLYDNILKDGTITDLISLQTIEAWAVMYGNLEKSSKDLKKCFGVQILIAIVISVSRYITYGFRFFHSLIKENNFHGAYANWYLANLVFSTSYHIAAVFLVILAGQRVLKEAAVLRVTLARLYNTLTPHPERQELKRIRDFQRMVLKNPVKVDLMKSLPLGMPLLPAVMSIAIGYVLVMLQFNQDV